jgi:phosphoribosylformylglycinamidine (FGAM) synthase-like amidotransferase family enzyme
MKSAILVFPGINRERDMARALRLASGHEPAMVWHAETSLPKGTHLVVVPGGFSYGDYLRCGAIAARAPVMDAVRDFATAVWCLASATAFRSSANPDCCPAFSCAMRG